MQKRNKKRIIFSGSCITTESPTKMAMNQTRSYAWVYAFGLWLSVAGGVWPETMSSSNNWRPQTVRSCPSSAKSRSGSWARLWKGLKSWPEKHMKKWQIIPKRSEAKNKQITLIKQNQVNQKPRSQSSLVNTAQKASVRLPGKPAISTAFHRRISRIEWIHKTSGPLWGCSKPLRKHWRNASLYKETLEGLVYKSRQSTKHHKEAYLNMSTSEASSWTNQQGVSPTPSDSINQPTNRLTDPAGSSLLQTRIVLCQSGPRLARRSGGPPLLLDLLVGGEDFWRFLEFFGKLLKILGLTVEAPSNFNKVPVCLHRFLLGTFATQNPGSWRIRGLQQQCFVFNNLLTRQSPPWSKIMLLTLLHCRSGLSPQTPTHKGRKSYKNLWNLPDVQCSTWVSITVQYCAPMFDDFCTLANGKPLARCTG